ncbi:MAG: aminopeptidase, partial [Thermodesulfobacteriota bacterium]
MADKRIEKMASILVGHSLNVKRNETVMIAASTELAKPLVLECYKEVLKRGGHPLTSIALEECTNIFFDNATKAQIEHLPKTKVYESKNIDCFINIRAPHNKKALSTVDPKKAGQRAMALMSISNTIVNRNRWVLTNFPTNALAQEADMSLVEYENFLYGAVNIDWAKAERAQTKLKRILDKGKTVHIVGKETDLTLSIKGRPGIKCCGHRNMPDGEVFLSPVENSAEGHIFYEMPAIYQ